MVNVNGPPPTCRDGNYKCEVTASLYIARFVPETTEQIHSGGIRDDLLAVSLVWSSCVLDITADVYADSGSFTANSLQGT